MRKNYIILIAELFTLLTSCMQSRHIANTSEVNQIQDGIESPTVFPHSESPHAPTPQHIHEAKASVLSTQPRIKCITEEEALALCQSGTLSKEIYEQSCQRDIWHLPENKPDEEYWDPEMHFHNGG